MPDGYSGFFLSRYLQKKKQIHQARQEKNQPNHRELLYIIGSYGLRFFLVLLRIFTQPISLLCIRFASSHCLFPSRPRPTSYAVAEASKTSSLHSSLRSFILSFVPHSFILSTPFVIAFIRSFQHPHRSHSSKQFR